MVKVARLTGGRDVGGQVFNYMHADHVFATCRAGYFLLSPAPATTSLRSLAVDSATTVIQTFTSSPI